MRLEGLPAQAGPGGQGLTGGLAAAAGRRATIAQRLDALSVLYGIEVRVEVGRVLDLGDIVCPGLTGSEKRLVMAVRVIDPALEVKAVGHVHDIEIEVGVMGAVHIGLETPEVLPAQVLDLQLRLDRYAPEHFLDGVAGAIGRLNNANGEVGQGRRLCGRGLRILGRCRVGGRGSRPARDRGVIDAPDVAGLLARLLGHHHAAGGALVVNAEVEAVRTHIGELGRFRLQRRSS